jgi:hypothetical protein
LKSVRWPFHVVRASDVWAVAKTAEQMPDFFDDFLRFLYTLFQFENSFKSQRIKAAPTMFLLLQVSRWFGLTPFKPKEWRDDRSEADVKNISREDHTVDGFLTDRHFPPSIE